jgi:hypothetical protein
MGVNNYLWNRTSDDHLDRTGLWEDLAIWLEKCTIKEPGSFRISSSTIILW